MEAAIESLDLQLLAEGLQFPEGPVALADGSVLLVEIRGGTLTRVSSAGDVERLVTLGGGPNGAAIGPDGAVYVCNNGGFEWRESEEGIVSPHGMPDGYVSGSIQRVDLENGSVTTLYSEAEGQPLRGPNDIVFDRQGGFWFTDVGKSNESCLYHGGVFYAAIDGSSIVCARKPMFTPNGIGLSADEKTLYVAETLTGRLWAIEIAAPGRLAPQAGRFAGRLLTTLPDMQLFDSLALQQDGAVCVATLVSGRITSVHPNGAMRQYAIPEDPFVTNICFGGEDLRDVWITSSGRGRLYRTRWPQPGLRLNFNA